LLLYVFRADTRTINLPYAFNVIEIGSTFLAVPRVIAFIAVMVVAFALWIFMQWTDTGKAIRAVAKEKLGAELSGIDVAHIHAVTFGLGTACVAIAACLLIPTYYVNPTAGDAFVLIAFTIVVLGGMGSILGALVGGLFVGVVESFSSIFLGQSLGQIGIFVMFIVTLVRVGTCLAAMAGNIPSATLHSSAPVPMRLLFFRCATALMRGSAFLSVLLRARWSAP
jgi:branched-chain amino acid transport system permease protein